LQVRRVACSAAACSGVGSMRTLTTCIMRTR
jgi:hypothetical protein